MTGMLRIKVMIPAVATAPAPIYLTYRVQSCAGLMSAINRAVSGNTGTVKPSPQALIEGMMTIQASNPPPTMTAAIRGPRI